CEQLAPHSSASYRLNTTECYCASLAPSLVLFHSKIRLRTNKRCIAIQRHPGLYHRSDEVFGEIPCGQSNLFPHIALVPQLQAKAHYYYVYLQGNRVYHRAVQCSFGVAEELVWGGSPISSGLLQIRLHLVPTYLILISLS